MSILTAIWRHITNNSSNTHKKYRVAFFTSQPSETMSHYIGRLSAYFEILAPNNITVVTYEHIERPSVTKKFLTEHAGAPFDGALAIDCTSARGFLRLKMRLGLEMPAVILGFKELLPANLPSDVIGIYSPDLSASYLQLFQRIYPQARRYLLIATPGWIEKTAFAQNLIKKSNEAGVGVDYIYLDETRSPLEEQFAQYAPGATFAYLAFNGAVFKHAARLVELCHQYGIIAIASNIHAIHYNADIIFGHPETKTFRYIVGRLFALMHGGATVSDSLNMHLQLHCNTSNLRNGHQYVFDNIGSLLIDSDVSVHLHTNNKAQR